MVNCHTQIHTLRQVAKPGPTSRPLFSCHPTLRSQEPPPVSIFEWELTSSSVRPEGKRGRYPIYRWKDRLRQRGVASLTDCPIMGPTLTCLISMTGLSPSTDKDTVGGRGAGDMPLPL